MIEELAERTTLSRTSSGRRSVRHDHKDSEPKPLRLRAIDSIKGLIEKESDRPGRIHPGRTVLVEVWRVVEEREDVCDHESESTEGDLDVSNV